MLVLISALVVVLPAQLEVKRVEKFDVAVESCRDQADVIDVANLRDRRRLGLLVTLHLLISAR